MMTKLHHVSFIIFLFCSCNEKKFQGNEYYNAQADIRMGTKFYSIYLNEQGHAYVIKGVGSYFTDTLKVESSDTSMVFKLDSVSVFFENLNKIKAHPIIKANRGDSPRVEIYYEQQKVYDAHEWDETFWNLFRPIMEEIPKGYNPFRANDNPFN